MQNILKIVFIYYILTTLLGLTFGFFLDQSLDHYERLLTALILLIDPISILIFLRILLKTENFLFKEDRNLSYILSIVYFLIFLILSISIGDYSARNSEIQTGILFSSAVVFPYTFIGSYLFLATITTKSFHFRHYLFLLTIFIGFLSGGRFGFLLLLFIIVYRAYFLGNRSFLSFYTLKFTLIIATTAIMSVLIAEARVGSILRVLSGVSNNLKLIFDLLILNFRIKFDTVYYVSFYNTDVDAKDYLLNVFYKMFWLFSGSANSHTGNIVDAPKYIIAQNIGMVEGSSVAVNGINLEYTALGLTGILLTVSVNFLMVFLFRICSRFIPDLFLAPFVFTVFSFPTMGYFNFIVMERLDVLQKYFFISIGIAIIYYFLPKKGNL